MENVNEIVAAIQVEMRGILNRLDKLEKLTSSVNDLALSVKELVTKQEATEQEINRMSTSVDELRQRPARRWDALIAALISAGVGIVLGVLFKTTMG